MAGSAALRNLIGLVRVGESVQVTVLRDGQRREIEARIGEKPTAGQPEHQALSKLSGARFQDLDRQHPQSGRMEGVLVADVEQGSPAWRNGLRSADIILAVNRTPVSDKDALTTALASAGPTVTLNIVREGMGLFLVIR